MRLEGESVRVESGIGFSGGTPKVLAFSDRFNEITITTILQYFLPIYPVLTDITAFLNIGTSWISCIDMKFCYGMNNLKVKVVLSIKF